MVESAEDLITPEIIKQFKQEDEHVMFSEKTKKLKAFGPADELERIYIMTTDNIYTFKKTKKGAFKQTRFYRIQDVGAIILSNENEEDFMLFFHLSEDLHLSSHARTDLLSLLTLRFFSFNRNQTLKIYSVTTSQLLRYHQTNNAKNKIKGVYDLPEESTRLLEQEIKGEDEYNAELSGKKGGIDDNPWEAKPGVSASGEFNFQGAFNKNFEGQSMKDDDFAKGRGSIMVGSKAKNSNVKFEDFKIITLLGRGTFGKVFLAKLPGSEQQYAIKAIRKDVLLDFKQVANTKLEKDILFSCEHPFLCGMDYMFQSQTRLYFVMPFVRGGELYKIFKSRKRLPESLVKFYALQICMAVGYLHTKGIMHRDLKLENILVDETGYLKVIDYGLAKTLQDSAVSKTFCGTPEYLAPEMVTQSGHDFSVDWWALGILIYEMLIGVTPFYNRERKLLLLKIRQSRVVFPDKKKYKIDYSDEFVDIVLKLLDKNKTSRLGSTNDFQEIIDHPFFAEIDKEKIMLRQWEPPVKITMDLNENGFDQKFFNAKNAPQDLTETVLPQAKLDNLKKKAGEFADFEKTAADLSAPGKVYIPK